MTFLRSFQETKASELRIRCMMHVCTAVRGNTVGKPVSPSTTAIRISCRPRVWS